MGPPLFGHPRTGRDEQIEAIEFGSGQQAGAHHGDGCEVDRVLASVADGCLPMQGRWCGVPQIDGDGEFRAWIMLDDTGARPR